MIFVLRNHVTVSRVQVGKGRRDQRDHQQMPSSNCEAGEAGHSAVLSPQRKWVMDGSRNDGYDEKDKVQRCSKPRTS